MADQIRQLSNGGSVVLPQRPLRLLGGILGAVAFTAFGVLMIVLGVRDAQAKGVHAGTVWAFVLGVVRVGLFGVLCPTSLVLATVHPRRLVLTAEGFREEVRRANGWETVGRETVGRVPWGEVAELSITCVPMPRWPGKGRRSWSMSAPMRASPGSIGRPSHAVRGHAPRNNRTNGSRCATSSGRPAASTPLFDAAHREFGDASDQSGTRR